MQTETCVFDAYGTLFDVDAAARAVAGAPGGEALAACWERVAANWRLKQLSYTWLRGLARAHVDFWTVTRDALDWTLEAEGLADPELRDRLLALYWELPAYPEVPATLEALAAQGCRLAILSNGSPDMLRGAIEAAGLQGAFAAVISVEEVGVFKPDPRVYRLIGAQLDTAPEQVLYASANGWDAACATGFGLRAAWINRTGAPAERLPWRPAHELPDLGKLPGLTGRKGG